MLITSFQKLSSMSIDVKAIAKLSYMKFSGDINAEVQTKTKEISSFDSKATDSKDIYIGGPPDQNWVTWATNLRQNPSPILYKTVSLTDLFIPYYFSNKNVIQQDLDAMKTQLSAAFDAYCKSASCAVPMEDPVPSSIVANYFSTDAFGGNGGSSFSDPKPSSPMMDIIQVIIRSGAQIDAIQLVLSDGITTTLTSYQGGTGGEQKTFTVPDGESISQIEVRAGARVDGLRFITNKGTMSEKFGGDGGSYHLVTLPGALVGLNGRSGASMDQISFIYNIINYDGKTISNDGTCSNQNNRICPGNMCCSSSNWCGVTIDYCGYQHGCQSGPCI